MKLTGRRLLLPIGGFPSPKKFGQDVQTETVAAEGNFMKIVDLSHERAYAGWVGYAGHVREISTTTPRLTR